MILLLIALISVTAIACLAAFNTKYSSLFTDVFAPVIAFAGFAGLFIYVILVLDYVGAGYKKDVLNREYGTSYTQNEIFYAGSVIETIRQLERKRIELNGDLITGKE